MILIMLSLIENNGKVIPQTFANKLKQWVNNGFAELNDTSGNYFGGIKIPEFVLEIFSEKNLRKENQKKKLAGKFFLMVT